MSVIEFRTLGTLDLRAADGRELYSLLAQSKRIALLAYLCIGQPPGFHRRDKLLGLFWPDADHDHARTSLRKSLHILRQSLGEDTILSRGDEDVSVNFERISCDAVKFEESLRAERFEEALELYQGDLLPGFFVDEAPEFEQWLTSERARLRSSSARGALAVASEFETLANITAAITWTRRSLQLFDTDEVALRKLIELQHRAGDPGGAIQSYEAFAGHLASEYQTEPSGETRSLIERVRSGGESSSNGLKARVFVGDESARTAPPIAESISKGEKRSRREKMLFVLAAASVLVVAGFMSTLLRPASANSAVRFTLVLNSTEPLAMRMPEAGRLAISPDGSRIAYLSGSQNNPYVSALRMRQWNDLHATAISGSQDSNTPFFSPDGRSIGFLRQRSVWIASAAGGPPVQVSDSLSGTAGASWGNDGFIYVDGFEFTPLVRVEAKPHSPAKWFTALDSARGEMEHTWPCVLPNGKGVLFTVTISGKDRADGQASFAIAVADIPWGKHRIIIQDGAYPVYITTGHVLYVNAKRTLMMVPFDQNSMSVTGEPTALTDSMRREGFGAGTDLAASANGTLVYSPDTGMSKYLTELVWITPEGLSIQVDPAWHGFFGDPSISPDGKLLAISDAKMLTISDRREIASTDVWIKQLDRGPATRLTQERIVNESPTWTPDGKSVTFNAHSGDGRYNLWTQRTDRTEAAERIPHAGGMSDARWSPDGKWLVFTAGKFVGPGKFDRPTQLDVLGFRPGIDKAPVALVKGKYIEARPEISPDGRWLAYQSNETGLFQIYVVPFPNTREGKWAVTTAGGTQVRWGRLGNELFYRDTSAAFYSVPVRSSPRFWSGTPKLVYQGNRFEFPLLGYAVAPDDRLLAVHSLDPYAADKIVVVQNWFEELKSKLH